MSDRACYDSYLKTAEDRFEDLCDRCGACCGANDDPCANLYKTDNGGYLCRSYESRIGPQVTISGHKFTCVSIRRHIADGTLRPGCGYSKLR